jgi:hypothetical protein
MNKCLLCMKKINNIQINSKEYVCIYYNASFHSICYNTQNSNQNYTQCPHCKKIETADPYKY